MTDPEDVTEKVEPKVPPPPVLEQDHEPTKEELAEAEAEFASRPKT